MLLQRLKKGFKYRSLKRAIPSYNHENRIIFLPAVLSWTHLNLLQGAPFSLRHEQEEDDGSDKTDGRVETEGAGQGEAVHGQEVGLVRQRGEDVADGPGSAASRASGLRSIHLADVDKVSAGERCKGTSTLG